jgi:hypothetical protein
MPNRDLNGILQLWTRSLPKAEHVLAFAEHYTDPVVVNGTPLSLDAMVDRAHGQQRALSDIEVDILEQVDTEDRSIIAFRQRGRHTGPLSTPLGEVAATGKIIERQIIDILRFEGSRICQIYVVADELGGLLQLGAVALKAP